MSLPSDSLLIGREQRSEEQSCQKQPAAWENHHLLGLIVSAGYSAWYLNKISLGWLLTLTTQFYLLPHPGNPRDKSSPSGLGIISSKIIIPCGQVAGYSEVAPEYNSPSFF